MYNRPLAYFISWRTYGTWLHGDSRGSVDRRHNRFGAPLLPPSEYLDSWEAAELKHAPIELNALMRETVELAIRDVCRHRAWNVLALNVRTNHVHTVVVSEAGPERAMTTFKAWATRRLVEASLVERGSRVWSRHGSTVYLFRPDKVAEKVEYVLNGQ